MTPILGGGSGDTGRIMTRAAPIPKLSREARKRKQLRDGAKAWGKASRGFDPATGKRSLAAIIEAQQLAESTTPNLVPPKKPLVGFSAGILLVLAGWFVTTSFMFWGKNSWLGLKGVGAIAGLVLLVTGLRVIWRFGIWLKTRFWFGGIATILAIVGVWATGLVTQPHIDGRPIRQTSATAAAIRTVDQLRNDLYTLAALDEFLVMDLATARLHRNDLVAARNTLRLIADRYQNVSSAPNEQLLTAQRSTRNAAAVGVTLFEKFEQLVLGWDNNLSREVDTLRETYVTEVIRAGEYTRWGANEAGVPSGPPQNVQE